MAQIFVSIPLFLVLSVLQSVAVSRITFLAGTADIVLLAIIAWIIIDDEGNHIIWAIIGGFFISILSAMPFLIVISVYLLAAIISKLIHRLLWQSPVLTIFISTAISTSVQFFIELFTLMFLDIPAPFFKSLGSIFMPSLLLNLFMIFPVYILMIDILKFITPKDEKYAG